MKKVTLYAGCRFDLRSRSGYYFSALEYNNVIKRISGRIEGEYETPNRIVIYGLIEAINLIKEPCELVILTCTPVGFSKINKSINADLLIKLKDLITEKGCTFEYETILKREIDIKTLAINHKFYKNNLVK